MPDKREKRKINCAIYNLAHPAIKLLQACEVLYPFDLKSD
jgi:hypothetical protein